MQSEPKVLESGVRLLNAGEIEAIAGGDGSVSISDDCCKNPRLTWSCDSSGCTGPVVDCD